MHTSPIYWPNRRAGRFTGLPFFSTCKDYPPSRRSFERHSVPVCNVGPGDDLRLLSSNSNQHEICCFDRRSVFSNHREPIQDFFGHGLCVLLWSNNASSVLPSFYRYLYLFTLVIHVFIVGRNRSSEISRSAAFDQASGDGGK